MKLAIVLTFSFSVATATWAECKNVAEHGGSKGLWLKITNKFGDQAFPKEIAVCIGRHYFFELKGGAKMQSALDRSKMRILLRKFDMNTLQHELLHIYVDVSKGILPYSVSEPIVREMESKLYF